MATNGNKNGNFRFNQVYFNDREKSHYEKWIAGRQTDVLDILQTFADQGLKLSLSFDNQKDVYIASITFKKGKAHLRNQVFMIRHADLEKLIRITLFYLTEVIDYGANLQPEKSDYDW